jgi:hypothetical protein
MQSKSTKSWPTPFMSVSPQKFATPANWARVITVRISMGLMSFTYPSVYSVGCYGEWWTTNWEGFERKRSWPKRWYLIDIYLDGLGKIKENFSHVCRGRDSTRTSPECKTRALPLHQPAQCKIILIGRLSASYLVHPLVSHAMVLYIFKHF